MPWGELTRIVRNGMRLDESSTLFFIFSKKGVQTFVVDLNTQGQLYQGVNSEGIELESIGGEYSPITKWLKGQEGLPFDRVTLYDTGEFYESFTIIPDREGITIQADTMKDGEDLQSRWGTSLLGLTDESTRLLAEYVIEDIRGYLLEQILR